MATRKKVTPDLPRFSDGGRITVEVTNAATAEGIFLALQLMAESGYKLNEWYFTDTNEYDIPNTITFERVEA